MSFERSYSIESHERIKLILIFANKTLLLKWWVTYILRKGKVSSLKWHKFYCPIMFLPKVIKNNIYYKIKYKIIRNEIISQNLVLLCLEHIYLLFSVKNENREKISFITFWLYLISACCNIWLISVCDATYTLYNAYKLWVNLYHYSW